MEKIYADCVWLLMSFEFHKLEPYLLGNTKHVYQPNKAMENNFLND